MNNNELKEPAPSWKGCIGFAVFNLLLTLLCTKLGIILVSTGLVLILILGIGFSIQCIREDWKWDFKASAVVCVVGLALQCGITVLYAYDIIRGLIAQFIRG